VDFETAGMVAYAAALSAVLVSFVLFNVNSYQITDVRQEFNFKIYFALRTITTTLTCLVLFSFLLIERFNRIQTNIILLFFFIFLVDAYANVFKSDLHQKGMVRLVARMRALSFSLTLIVFVIAILITHEVTIALASAGAVMFVVNIVWVYCYRGHFGKIHVEFDFQAIIRLTKMVFPMFMTLSLSVYLINAPKYYLEMFLTSESVAMYAILFFPAGMFQIVMTTMFFGAPLPDTSELYASGELKRFLRRIHQQLMLVTATALPYLLITYFLGVPVILWLYNTDISMYFRELILITASGLFITVSPIIGMALIIMRRQKQYLYAFATVSALTSPIVIILVQKYGLVGAAIVNFVVFAPTSVLLYAVFRVTLNREMLKSTIGKQTEVL